jgi:hypothetical protein
MTMNAEVLKPPIRASIAMRRPELEVVRLDCLRRQIADNPKPRNGNRNKTNTDGTSNHRAEDRLIEPDSYMVAD